MLRSFIALLIAICAAPAAASQQARPIHIIYVEPPGAVWTAEEQAAARASVQRALDFWQHLAPAPLPLSIASARLITSTDDIYDQFDWSRPYFAGPPDLTLFLIDGATPLLGQYTGQSQTPLGLIWVLYSGGADVEATLAHELGHVVYGLPHQYEEKVDIMGLAPLIAYQVPTIGCASLAALGRPCARVWLPLIALPPGA
jgi:hypothetical protein